MFRYIMFAALLISGAFAFDRPSVLNSDALVLRCVLNTEGQPAFLGVVVNKKNESVVMHTRSGDKINSPNIETVRVSIEEGYNFIKYEIPNSADSSFVFVMYLVDPATVNIADVNPKYPNVLWNFELREFFDLGEEAQPGPSTDGICAVDYVP